MITDGLREFVARDWTAVRAAKDRYWSERVARLGPMEAFRVSDELRQQTQMAAPGWPTTTDRQNDFEFHVHLAALLRRVRPACRA